jgi:hypothetical protein
MGGIGGGDGGNGQGLFSRPFLDLFIIMTLYFVNFYCRQGCSLCVTQVAIGKPEQAP